LARIIGKHNPRKIINVKDHTAALRRTLQRCPPSDRWKLPMFNGSD
jgi:hypothetical protein